MVLLKRDARCSLSHLEGDEVGRDSLLGATFTLGKRTESTTQRRAAQYAAAYNTNFKQLKMCHCTFSSWCELLYHMYTTVVARMHEKTVKITRSRCTIMCRSSFT